MVANAKSAEELNFGVQGTTTLDWNNAVTGNDYANHAAGSYDVVWHWPATNDVNGNITTPTEFETNTRNVVANVIPLLKSGGKMVLFGSKTPTSTSAKGLNSAVIQTKLALIAADPTYGGKVVAVTTAAFHGVNLTVYNSSTNPTGDINGALHYMTTAHQKLANNFLAMNFTATTAYTVSLSASSGAVGSTITLTYTRANGSTWVTGDSVTTSDGGASGTFGAFTFTPGQTTATRTYTSAINGVLTLTHSNSVVDDNGNALWGNPAADSYTSGTGVSLGASPTTIERGAAFALTLTSTGINLGTAIASDFTVTGASGLSYNQTTHVLSGTAAASSGSKTLTHVPTGSTVALTETDTTSPSTPTGLASASVVDAYNFTLSWTAVSPSPAGETITYRVYKNAVELTTSPGQSGTSYNVLGAVNGDVFTVKARDDTGNESSLGSYTFTAPGLPNASDIRLSVVVKGVTGTLDLPATSNVKSGIVYDNTTKTGTYLGDGAGADNVTINVTNGSTALQNVMVFITTDSSGATPFTSVKRTDSSGNVTFKLTAGSTYYLWALADGSHAVVVHQSFVAVAD
jgi:hypothetical protein